MGFITDNQGQVEPDATQGFTKARGLEAISAAADEYGEVGEQSVLTMNVIRARKSHSQTESEASDVGLAIRGYST